MFRRFIIAGYTSAFALLSGCFFDESGIRQTIHNNNGVGPDGAVGWDGSANVDGTTPVDGSGQADRQVGSEASVQPDAFVQQDAAGQVDSGPTCDPAQCPLGCHPTEPRCQRLDPANFDVQSYYAQISSGLNVGSGETVTVNTDNGSINGWSQYRPAGSAGQAVNGIYYNVVQSGGVQMAVIGLTSLQVDGTIQVEGRMPVAFYVKDNVTINGRINARASGEIGGPGGGNGGHDDGDDGAACGNGSQGIGGGQTKSPTA